MKTTQPPPSRSSSSPELARYRPGVGIVLFNRASHVLIAERLDNPGSWQMPQGGIDEGEAPETAVFREMEEEIGTRNAEILGMLEDWLCYDFSPALSKKLWNGQYTGQRQKWIALRFTGSDAEIDPLTPRNNQPAEFDQWRWERLDRVADLVVPFRREVYRTVAQRFAAYAEGGSV